MLNVLPCWCRRSAKGHPMAAARRANLITNGLIVDHRSIAAHSRSRFIQASAVAHAAADQRLLRRDALCPAASIGCVSAHCHVQLEAHCVQYVQNCAGIRVLFPRERAIEACPFDTRTARKLGNVVLLGGGPTGLTMSTMSPASKPAY
jgi:hypothetical protein